MQPVDANPRDLSRDTRAQRTIADAASVVLIILATLVAYRPALFGGMLWDDDVYVSKNPLLFAPDGLWRIWTRPHESPQYYPLVFTTFWLEVRLHGASTFGLHFVNVILHAINAVLLWFVLRRLQVPGAWLAGAIFALHPVHVESVAWITERKNVLSGMFFLLSVAAYARFADGRRRPFYVAALLCFLCALLSKTATCFLPVVLLVLQWWKRIRLGRRDALDLLPFFCVGLLFGLATVHFEKHNVGAVGEEWSLFWVERGLLANRALWFYVGKLLWPAKLAFNYPRWEIDAAAAWQYAFPALTIACAVLLWRFRARLGRATPVALSCFIAGIAPVLGLFDVYYYRYSYVADHFQYHASMGFIALIATGAMLALRRLAVAGDGGRRILTHAALLIPLVCALLAYRQAGLYTDAKTLWQRTVAQNPSSVLAHYELAVLLVRDKEHNDEAVRAAREHLQAVLEINPRCAEAHRSLAIIAGRRGRHDQAMRHYRAALDIDPTNPNAHYNMARELERGGEVEHAIAAYRACLDSAPAFAPAHNCLGRIFLGRGLHRKAAEHFELACAADPRNAPALRNLGMVYEDRAQYTDAVAYYRKALAINPGMAEAWFRVGVCLRKTGDLDGAEAAYHSTLALDSAHADALADLAAIHYEKGLLEEASQGYRGVLTLEPGDVQCRLNLAAVLWELGRYAGALAVLDEGLRLQPDELALMHRLAKLLATSPDVSLRDGVRALKLAKKVVDHLDPPRPEAFGTLAAAYAEVRAYDRAVESARQAVELARALSLADLEEDLTRQLRGYEARRHDLPDRP